MRKGTAPCLSQMEANPTSLHSVSHFRTARNSDSNLLDFKLLTSDSSITGPYPIFQKDWRIGEICYSNVYFINLSFVLFLFGVFGIFALQSEVYSLTV
jgi:hypothetical protein